MKVFSCGGRSRASRGALGALFFLALALALGCGGGGSTRASSSASTAGFSLSVPSLSLPVGTVGTVTVAINRDSTFTSAVNLSVTSTLPTGIKASFASTSVTASGTTDVLTIEAGYPDPTDSTFATQILPSAGLKALTITGVSATDSTKTVTATLNLTVTSGSADYALSLLTNVDGSYYLDGVSALTLHPGTDLDVLYAAYNSGTGSVDYPSSTAVTLSTVGLPDGLTVTFADNPVALDYVQTLTLHASSSLASGTYGFSLVGTTGSVTRYLPMVVTASSGYFWVQPVHALTVEQGSSVTLPLGLGRNDTFFQDNGGTNPDYLDSTTLSLSSPTGLTASFLDADGTAVATDNPTTLAQEPLKVTAGASLTPGDYTVTLKATRNGTPTTLAVPVTVTEATTTPITWIQKVEWGQSVLSDTLRLVPGKPALLRVHLLADRAQVTSPTVTATLLNGSTTLDTVTLTGPTTVPTAISEGSLPETFTATLPAADIVSGMTVRLDLTSDDASSTTEFTPLVESSAMVLDLTLVPVIHKSLVPSLPTDTALQTGIKAYWPVQDVSITRRAAYTTTTEVPLPVASTSTATDYSSDGWSELLAEIAALKVVDGSSSSYFGYFNADLGSLAEGTSSIVGLHYLGYGAGLALDLASSALFGNASTICVQTTIHELGHGFNLNHAPVGGAGSPQMNYPYAGGSIGSYGYDPAAGALYAPDTMYDIMGYQDPTWVSDWNYTLAQSFLESLGSFDNHAVASVASAEHLVVSGWIGPDGQAHLAPIARATCRAQAPTSGGYQLALTSGSGTRQVAFQATQVGCLPKGYRVFAFTVAADEELAQVDVLEKGKVLATRKAAASVAGTALKSTVVEKDGFLHITWDATTDPVVSVVHVGAVRTTLALRLQGGTAVLPLADMPTGGRFEILGSDGINHRKPSKLERKAAD